MDPRIREDDVRRWIPAYARMKDKCCHSSGFNCHSCAEPALDLIGGRIHPRPASAPRARRVRHNCVCTQQTTARP
jgi:hypothetical protein